MSDMDKIIKEIMRDDGLIHARNGNLKSMQHSSSEAHNFMKYEDVQKSQIKHNEELFKDLDQCEICIHKNGTTFSLKCSECSRYYSDLFESKS